MLSIHPVGTASIPVIRQLAYAIWPAAYGNILSSGQLEYMLNLMYSHDALAQQMNEGQQFYIVYKEEQPVGFAAIGLYKHPVFKLHKIYVSPHMQGQGVGKHLLHFLFHTLKEQNASALILNVNRQNPALQFYKKMGFTVIEEVDKDIGGGYFMNDYVMRILL